MPDTRLAAFRLGAPGARLGKFTPWTEIWIDSVERGGDVRISGAGISQHLNHTPDTMTFRCHGFVPRAGHVVRVYCGGYSTDRMLFGGRILDAQALYEELPANVAYDCSCIDPTWLLNRQKVLKHYVATSATDIAKDLMATCVRGVGVLFVQPNLPLVDEFTLNNVTPADALTQLVERIGGYWYIDYAEQLHLYLEEGPDAGTITQANPRGSRGHALSEDLSQVVTRVIGLGGGSQAMSEVTVGMTNIPVEDASWYSAPGLVQVGTKRISYTAVKGVTEKGANTGFVQPPPAPVASAVGYPSAGLAPGTYLLALTYKTGEGETAIGPTISVVVPNSTDDQIWITPIPTAPADEKVHAFGVYISTTNGGVGTMKLLSENTSLTEPNWWGFDWPLSYIPITALPTGVTSKSPPSIGTAGIGSLEIDPGASAIQVDDLTAFESAGWALLPGGQIIRYTGRSGTTGSGTLTGIPPTGPGAITAPVRSGTIRMLPYLDGIPVEGLGAVTYPIQQGDAVTIRIELEDIPAVNAMAVRLVPFTGAVPVYEDGIVEETVSDSRYTKVELTEVCEATLRDRKDPHKTVTFETRDPSCEVGRLVTVALTTPAIAGTFRIQRVQLTEIAAAGATRDLLPLRRVEASSRLFTFTDILRQLRKSSVKEGAF